MIKVLQHTLKMFNTGQITLPKKRRSQFETNHFLAIETSEGLLLKPVLEVSDDTVYYESKDGSFGLYSQTGINSQQIIDSIKLLQKDG